jgi:hypothetical protein
MIRFFCQVAPSPLGDLGYEYLTALASRVQVRAIPIGPAAALGFEKRWWRAGNLFTVPLAVPYVNVVCVLTGTAMGVRAPAATMGTADDLPDDLPPELRAAMVRGARKSAAREGGAKPLVYEPTTVLEGMYTVGCKNVAIVLLGPARLDEKEIATLTKYDLVISPRVSDVSTLAAAGVQAVHLEAYRADDLVNQLELACLCSFDITATSAPSTGSDAPRATTSARSSTTATSTSTSRRSATHGEHPTSNPASEPSTTTSGSPSMASPMWRSFIRRLAFWRRS